MVGGSVHTPLHVAANWGHLEFVRKLLDNNKALAGVLDERRQSALHLAAANGHDKIVEVLVEANANMCLTPDGDGRNPLHRAAVEGHDSVLSVFFEKNPHWIHEMLKAIDGGGNTILHLAVMNKKSQVVDLLLVKIKDEMKMKNIQETENPLNTINKCGCTALDIMERVQSPPQDCKESKKNFRKAGALKAATLKVDELLSKRQNALLVAASLMATMAFQVGVTHPGGVWQDNGPNNSTNNNSTDEFHKAGEAVVAYYYSETGWFFVANTIGFVASLSTILFLVTGLPFKKKLFTRIMVLTMCIAVTSIAFTYAFSIASITPDWFWNIVSKCIYYGMIVWCGVICVLVLIHTIPLLKRRLKVRWDRVRPRMKLFMEFIPCSINGNENTV
ncbi:ankyrin repeat-containing protein ITN1-like [Diospyros lotus]|uniref:ankyrin repeat-containing protein ITN1-like n=1 Tax=Diospyros lotus TaxID=55363 RepID=UPI002255A3E2|nr:ankyrin repeat-containing protein ITN1-like [Diospyros lotus]